MPGNDFHFCFHSSALLSLADVGQSSAEAEPATKHILHFIVPRHGRPNLRVEMGYPQSPQAIERLPIAVVKWRRQTS
jgi:hypothetical protein